MIRLVASGALAETEERVEKRPWYERLFDRDSETGPFIVIAVLILIVGLMMFGPLGPLLDGLIRGG